MYQTLFGWKKGSFTGATEDGVGLIAASEKGTLFLDEIGYAEIKVQQSLLTFIEKGTYNRFGDPEERQSDVRLMFGTNQDLQRMIQDKEFAHDFYERISEREFVIPPLRERIADVELLVDKVISGLNHSTLCDIEISAEAIEELKQYKWPGNLRQLINYVKGLHDDCRYQRTMLVSLEMIKQSPPRDGSYTQQVVLENFQETIRSLIRNWEPSMGKILDDVIAPIVAKSYLDDLKMSRTDASKITGLDGTRGDDSTILHKLLQYESARKKFS